MKSKNKKLTLAFLAASALGRALPVLAQDAGPGSPPPSGGWGRFAPSTQAPPQDVPPPQEPAPQVRSRNQAPPRPLTVPAGKWITIPLNQPISSGHNQPGGMVPATLAPPITAQGRIIARRGQTGHGSG